MNLDRDLETYSYLRRYPDPASSPPMSQPVITKLTAAPDVLRVVFETLFPHELGNLSLTCKALHASVFSNDAIREKCLQRALEMSRRAEVLPNGAFRLYINMCRKFIDIRFVPRVLGMVTEFSFMNTRRHFISVRHEGVRYIGRGTDIFTSQIDGVSLSVKPPEADIFAAGNLGDLSVWVQRIEHTQGPRNPDTAAILVRIGINLGEGVTSSVCYTFLNCVPDGW